MQIHNHFLVHSGHYQYDTLPGVRCSSDLLRSTVQAAHYEEAIPPHREAAPIWLI